ncbi:mobilisation protein (MobC) [Oribacterium sp. KHPX15]|uniref:plasmid mobilization protein n=1 Tax=Oribacterium sp. KHPX15 TaxID=1855342 RepID=UPI00089BC234|nr:plasmid mobilization relaxosome protein MobC [Oribacterium sp. KHPX15]SEA18139.1 mobilisation protein (MobC) [Oribacterium sp. KHPX15]
MESKRDMQIHFFVTPEESEQIHKRIEESGIKNESAYYRKMLLNGYIIKMDLSDVKEMIRLLRINANNLNQYARKANECGSVYVDDIRDLQQQQKLLWVEMRKILEMLSKLNE